MTKVADLASGKGHDDENFPVASFLLRPEARVPVMAFYRFARAADDIADNPALGPQAKLALLAALRDGLSGEGAVEAMALREVMAARRIDPIHAHELLDAFFSDVTKTRCRDWDDLIGYCRLSAMPVGRYVLDVHGESRDLWPASDALCAALQIINHLQDCAKDYRGLGRVYIPLDTGVEPDDLLCDRATTALRAIITALVARTRELLARSKGFSAAIRDRRLAAEVSVIHRLAESLCDRLESRDPLSERVHHGKFEAAWLALGAAIPSLLRRAS
ncbi:squalene synthase HpnC [Sphingomonas sp. TX0543]|uniref:squalene synthase HpnC n=1 Tax=unclassified Sphingomonas TaxID=196159 RepID=UPI0010F9C198|nr:squalene synthase HpnC [Sphingomonas sp. 3P27F8]